MDGASEAALAALNEIAAAIARGEEPAGAYQWVTVYEVDGSESISLSADWFDGPRDERYGHTDHGYGPVSPVDSDGS